jgi:hypothetical protein
MKLNIGSGEKKLPGFINIDKYLSQRVDLKGDLDKKINLPNACAEKIMLDNVIEHVDSIPNTMKEIRRLLKKSGVVHIYTPHFTSHSSWRDPTHKYHLSYFSFDMFTNDRNAHYLGGKLFALEKKKLSFGSGLSMLGRLIFKISPDVYEKKFSYIFPASTLYVKLRAI